MFENFSEMMLELFATSLWETVVMVGASGIVGGLVGIPLGVFLRLTDKGGVLEHGLANKVVGGIVNAVRSTPFIILLVAIIPFTRLVTGTTIGVWAAIVPLSISATPFFARIAEVSLREIDPGLIEAAQAMGCKKWHIVRHVLLPEALPGIVGGFTITLVALISSSAMAGAVGAGGLGDLAIRYGYQRFDTQVMVVVIAILIALVTVVQFAGDRLVHWLRNR